MMKKLLFSAMILLISSQSFSMREPMPVRVPVGKGRVVEVDMYPSSIERRRQEFEEQRRREESTKKDQQQKKKAKK